jgi:hypothetical protein
MFQLYQDYDLKRCFHNRKNLIFLTDDWDTPEEEELPAIATDPTTLDPPTTPPINRLGLTSPHPVHPLSPPPPIGKPSVSKFHFKFSSKYN